MENSIETTTGEEMLSEVVKTIKEEKYDHIILAAAKNIFVIILVHKFAFC